MGMTRAAAVTYLGGIYAQQLSEAGLAATDDAANLGPAIDRSLIALGVAYEDLATAEVASADVPGYYALLAYFGLARIHDAVVNRVDVQMGDPNTSKNRSQYVRQLAARLDDLRKEASAYGLTVGPTWQSATTIDFDFLEPVVWP